jgi:hypothetical protein
MRRVDAKFLLELLASDQPEAWQLDMVRKHLRLEIEARRRWAAIVQAKRRAKRAARIANEG